MLSKVRLVLALIASTVLLTGCRLVDTGGGPAHGLGTNGGVVDVRPPVAVSLAYDAPVANKRVLNLEVAVFKGAKFTLVDVGGKPIAEDVTKANLEFVFTTSGNKLTLSIDGATAVEYPHEGTITNGIGHVQEPSTTPLSSNNEEVEFELFGAMASFVIVVP